MPHRAHLFSLRIGHALREAVFDGERYSSARLLQDLLAGLTVGIIAIPLAMALAIASGVAPQFGLYTAIIGGFIIALTGGSRFSVSGPTAAFVVILYPIAHQYGLAGLLLATVMSGVILITMAFWRLGRYIEYIPESVTLGFTGGIAIVIATLQVKDFFGLNIGEFPELFAGKIVVLTQTLPDYAWPSVSVAVFTLSIMFLWSGLRTPIPPHLPAVIAGSLLAAALNDAQFPVDTIGSRFSYLLPDGSTGAGIPPYLPEFEWPWSRSGAGGVPLAMSWQLMRDLLPAAFAIAMLGAIESLLCAVVLDGMSGRRHSANSELLGQGIGNIITPFFGGITATAAIARSAANYKAGGQSPVSTMIHSLVVLAGLLGLAPLLAYLPMPTMAALLLVVAWNMSEFPKSLHLLRSAPTGDSVVFLVCLLLTVFFDMVMAITTGVLLAAVLFMKDIAEMTRVTDTTERQRDSGYTIPDGWIVFRINGPLFFAAADRIFGEMAILSDNAKGLILQLDGVLLLDAGGLSAMNRLIDKCRDKGIQIFFAELQFQPIKTLAKADINPIDGVSRYFSTLGEALDALHEPELFATKRVQST